VGTPGTGGTRREGWGTRPWYDCATKRLPMSYDNYEVEYCFTAKGWFVVGGLDPNEIVIERWLVRTYQGSGFGRESSHEAFIESNPEFSKEQRDEFHKKFSPPWSDEAKFQRSQAFSRDLEQLAKRRGISD
jgi:hypothetical protein